MTPSHTINAVCLASLALLNLGVQATAAEQSPVYRQLGGEIREPDKLNLAPVLLSRFPTTFSMALTSDGRQVRSADIEGRVWQRSALKTEERRLIMEMGCEPACAVLSSDARWLAFADAEGPVAVMDLDTAQIKFRDDAIAERGVALVFSADGGLLAGVTVGGRVRVWNVASGQCVHEFAVEAAPVQTMAFSPEGDRLAVASYTREVRIYPLDRQDRPARPPEPRVILAAGPRVTSLAFSPEGQRLVIATSDGAATLHELATDGEPRQLGTHPFAIWAIVFEANGHRMATGSWDGTIKLWDTASWQLIQSVKKHDESVAAMVFDGRRGLISAGLDGRLLYWLPEVPTIDPAGMIAGRGDSVWAAVYSPDGRRLFVGGRGNRFELWDTASHSLLITRTGHPTTRCAAFSPDGATLATGGDDGNILLCDASTGQTRATLARHPGSVSAVLFADEGRTLISACDGGLVKVWDTATGQAQASWHEHKQQIYCAALSPDETCLLTGGGDWTNGNPGELLVWERKTGRVRARLTGHRLAIWAIVFSPDGKRFFSSDSSGAVKVWDFATLAEERTLQHSTWVRPLALSPDGTTLAVGRGDGAVRLWNTSTWTEKASCDGHQSFCFWLQYTPDGKTLTSGGEDGTVRFWMPTLGSKGLIDAAAESDD